MKRARQANEERLLATLVQAWRSKSRSEQALWALLLVVMLLPRLIAMQPLMQNAYLTQPDEAYSIKEALGFGTGDLNPHRWTYPTLYPYLLAATYGLVFLVGHIFGVYSNLTHFAAQFFIDPRVFMWSGRVISLGAGLWQILAAKTIADRVFGPVAGWLAAFGLALSPLHVRLSAGAMPDMPAILFATLAVGTLCQIVRRPTFRGYLWTGVFIGLGTGTKYWPAFLVVVAIGTHIYAALTRKEHRRPSWRWPFAAAFAAFMVFFLTSPYLLIDAHEGLGRLKGLIATQLVSGEERVPWRQPVNGLARVLPIMLADGGGLWVATAVAGFGLALKRRSGERTVVVATALLLVGVFGKSKIGAADYLLPSFPFLWILAGYTGEYMGRMFVAHHPYRRAVPVVGLALLSFPLVQTAKQAIGYCQTDTFSLGEELFHKIAEDGDVVFVDFRSLNLCNSREHAIRATQDLRWFDGRPGGLPERKRIWRQYLKYANGPWYEPAEHSYVVVAKDVLGLSSLPVHMIPTDAYHPIPLQRFAAAGVEYIVFSDMIMERYVSTSLPLGRFYREVQSKARLVGKVTADKGMVKGPDSVQAYSSVLGVPRLGPTIFLYQVPGAQRHLQVDFLRKRRSE